MRVIWLINSLLRGDDTETSAMDARKKKSAQMLGWQIPFDVVGPNRFIIYTEIDPLYYYSSSVESMSG